MRRYYLFAEIPDIWSGVGALIIVVSTVYVARRAARRKNGAGP